MRWMREDGSHHIMRWRRSGRGKEGDTACVDNQTIDIIELDGHCLVLHLVDHIILVDPYIILRSSRFKRSLTRNANLKQPVNNHAPFDIQFGANFSVSTPYSPTPDRALARRPARVRQDLSLRGPRPALCPFARACSNMGQSISR